MRLLLPIFILLAQEPAAEPELAGTVRSDEYDFEMGLPKGWEASRTTGTTFFRAQAPPAVMADGAVWLKHHDSNHPVTLEFLAENFRGKGAADYSGFKIATERNITAGGYPGHQVVFTATARGDKELAFVHTVIQRQLQEYFILTAVAGAGDRERLVALADRMLASFRTGFPWAKDLEDRLARTAALLKSAPARPELAGTQWHELIVGDRKLGWQKTVLREAKVDGAPGWEFEIECRQEDAEGGTRRDFSKGAFTPDGSVQRVETQRTVRTAKDPPVDVRETASLNRGACRVVREFLDRKSEKEFKVPEGTFFADVADTMRRILALSPPGKNALRVLDPFRDIPTYEDWMNAGPSKIALDGKEEDLIQALATYPRQQPAEFLYDPDGTLRRRKGAGGFIVLRRCTEEEALRK